jgi:hypothetical protein
MSAFLRLPVVTLCAAGLLGCVSDCNVLSTSNSPLCTAGMVGLIVLTAPVLYVNERLSDAEMESRQQKLKEQVEAGDLAASEAYLFRHFKSRKEDLHLATDKVISTYGDAPDLTPRQQAVLFAAHVLKSRLLKKEDADAQMKHLDEVFRLGQSEAMWDYVRLNGNDLPVTGAYFSSVAKNAFVDFVRLEHTKQIAATGNPKFPVTCELSNYRQSSSCPVTVRIPYVKACGDGVTMNEQDEHYRLGAFHAWILNRTSYTDAEVKEYLELVKLDSDLSLAPAFYLLQSPGISDDQFNLLVSFIRQTGKGIQLQYLERDCQLRELRQLEKISLDELQHYMRSEHICVHQYLFEKFSRQDAEFLQIFEEQGKTKAIRYQAKQLRKAGSS